MQEGIAQAIFCDVRHWGLVDSVLDELLAPSSQVFSLVPDDES